MAVDLSDAMAAFEAELLGFEENNSNQTEKIESSSEPSILVPPAQQTSNSSISDVAFVIAEPAIINKELLPSTNSEQVSEVPAIASSYGPIRHEHYTKGMYSYIPDEKKKHIVRHAGGETWEDISLAEWPENDIRLFIGDLGNDVDDNKLHNFFNCYPSYARSKVVRDKRSHKSKGYGFVSFMNADDAMKAFREKNGKYIGSRPIKISRSSWEDREFQSREERKPNKKFNKY